MTKWEKSEHEVEYKLPCYRKYKDIRYYKVIDENSMIQITHSQYLNDIIELVDGGRLDPAFDKDTEESSAEEFDAIFSTIISKVNKAIHQ